MSYIWCVFYYDRWVYPFVAREQRMPTDHPHQKKAAVHRHHALTAEEDRALMDDMKAASKLMLEELIRRHGKKKDGSTNGA